MAKIGGYMNVSEYIVSFLEEKEIDTVFGVVGGAALWICKAFSESTKIKPVFTNHEQAAAMAADGWARVTGKPGIVFTINGPGMTNTVTGIAQAWTDSSPVILITGNSNLSSVKYEREKGIRQYGTQDIRTDRIMESITKKTYLIEEAGEAREILEEAYELALSGRPGPVCIEIPINIQSAEMLLEDKTDYIILKSNHLMGKAHKQQEDYVEEIVQKIIEAKKPLVLAGQGIRLAGAIEEFQDFIQKYKLPVVNSRMGIDTITSDSKYFVGRAGNHGTRAAHFAIQTCDVLFILGSRLAPNTTGYDVSKFSPQSYKILVEIDDKELDKYGLEINQKISIDLKQFLQALNKVQINDVSLNSEARNKWISCCNNWKQKYPIMQKEYYNSQKISTYRVIEEISNQAMEKDLILSDTGSCCSIVAQVWQIKKEQRLFISGGLSAMGYWATSMGLAVGNDGDGQVICLVGDGSLQMNIHELATIKAYKLPIKIFVINNAGYQFVRMSQASYGIIPPFGTDPSVGVPIPNIEKVVESYGLHYSSCAAPEKIREAVSIVLKSNQSEVCEIFVDENQEVYPRLKSIALEDGTFVSPEYENLYPFLDAEELKGNLLHAFF